MGNSVGRIDLDLNVNRRGFDQQMRGITGMAKKAGALIAGAFAVKGLIDFGRKAVELGSDLAEVQNVVDVTFGSMSKQVDEFAKSAAMSFGLSETMAKKYVGTFGAMSKAFGFSEKQAYDMSTALTGLAGDVASFYNLSQDEAYTKLKSVFTGETETLKDLGVVMTQNALDAYAMANGYGKTTAAMTEAEKVALRFAFVQDQLSLANGDFARTSDQWANQVRILQLQMQSFMATVGQGLINIFSPAIKVINLLMGKLIALANTFKAFTESIFGKKNSEQEKGATVTSEAIEDIGGAAAGTEKQVEKSAKAIKKSLAGFDKINKLSDSSSSGSAGSPGGAAGGVVGMDFNGGEIGKGASVSSDVGTAAEKIKSIFSATKRWYEMNFAPLFKNIGKELRPQIERLKQTLGGIWSDIGTLGAPLKAWVLNDLTPFLQQVVISTGEILTGLIDSFSMVFSDIWNLYVYPWTQQFLAVILPIIAQFCTQVVSTVGTLFGEIKRIFDLIWSEAVAPALSLIIKIWSEVWDTMQNAWNKWGVPVFDAIRTAVQSTGDIISTIWDTRIKPVWDTFMQTVDWLWEKHLQPLLANFLDFAGELAVGALEIYNQVIAPLITWFSEHLGPVISNVMQTIVTLFGTAIGTIADVINGLITILKGVVQFISGVFTGDWSKAWEGVVNVFKGVFQGISGILKGVVNVVIDLVNSMIRAVVNGVNSVAKQLNKISFDVPDWVPGLGGKSFGVKIPEMKAYQIPKLAEGGFVKANTPQLAMIGDNLHQGEIVAPEGKLKELLNAAVSASGGITKEEIRTIVNESTLRIVSALSELGFYVDSELMAKAVRTGELALDARYNPVKFV